MLLLLLIIIIIIKVTHPSQKSLMGDYNPQIHARSPNYNGNGNGNMGKTQLVGHASTHSITQCILCLCIKHPPGKLTINCSSRSQKHSRNAQIYTQISKI